MSTILEGAVTAAAKAHYARMIEDFTASVPGTGADQFPAWEALDGLALLDLREQVLPIVMAVLPFAEISALRELGTAESIQKAEALEMDLFLKGEL